MSKSRNDGILYAGSTNRVNRLAEIEAKREEKLSKRNQLVPDSHVVLEELEKEKDQTIKTLLSLINPTTPTDQVKELIVSLNLYEQSMKNLTAKFKNILRLTKFENREDVKDA